ncbi:winged helix-turn-helix domain-containing protein [Chloroflexota bacterium]
MLQLLIIAQENSKPLTELTGKLRRDGFDCSIISHKTNGLIAQIRAQSPDALLLEITKDWGNTRINKFVQNLKKNEPVPVIVLVQREKLDSIDVFPDVNDYLISPFHIKELALRIKRIVRKDNNTKDSEKIKCDSLIMDLAKCEVSLEGRIIELAFKEYELLKFLINNKGRVYTREALLDKVWGYDYYGGDRTVDVHIRRLRSKLEDAKHTFIETVRNIGYRFRDNR